MSQINAQHVTLITPFSLVILQDVASHNILGVKLVDHIALPALITIIVLDVIMLINALNAKIIMDFYQVIQKDVAYRIKHGVWLIMLDVLHV